MSRIKKLLLGSAMLLLLSACGGAGTEQPGPAPEGEAPVQEAPSSPVTLKMHFSISQDIFNKYIAEPVKAKYPHITMEYVNLPNDAAWEAAVIANEVPDLVWGPNNFLNRLKNLDLQTDLGELIKKHNFNVSAIEPSLLDDIKQFSDKGELYALPPNRATTALLYNKSLFDNFAVEYPKDNMTWEEVNELGGRMTRLSDGVQYYGVDFLIGDMAGQSGMRIFDANDKASVTNDGWRRLADLMVNIRRTSGHQEAPKAVPLDRFVKDQNLAMAATGIAGVFDRPEIVNQSFDWDMVSYPTYPDRAGYGTNGLAFIYAVTSISKHKDEAFKALSVVFDNELLGTLSQEAIILPSVTDESILSQYGKKNSIAAQKNVGALFKLKPSVADPHQFRNNSYNLLNTHVWSVVSQMTDTNTALRTAQEEIDKQWETRKPN